MTDFSFYALPGAVIWVGILVYGAVVAVREDSKRRNQR